jgi:hypothetical protein
MTWTDLAVVVGFVFACVGFWAALVAIALWSEMDQQEGDE